MTRHQDIEGNLALDRARIRRLTVVIVSLLCACAVMLLGPAVAPRAAPSDPLTPFPTTADETEPRPHPSFGATKTKESTDATPGSATPTGSTATTAARVDRTTPAGRGTPAAPTPAAVPGSGGDGSAPGPAEQPAADGDGDADPGAGAGAPGPYEPEHVAPVGLIELVNADRALAGCAPVVPDSGLDGFAQTWSNEQAATTTMKHSSEPFTGVPGWPGSSAENVAAGQESAAEVHADWMASAGHRENILNCSYTAVGIAASRGADGVLYWTEVFGG